MFRSIVGKLIIALHQSEQKLRTGFQAQQRTIPLEVTLCILYPDNTYQILDPHSVPIPELAWQLHDDATIQRIAEDTLLGAALDEPIVMTALYHYAASDNDCADSV